MKWTSRLHMLERYYRYRLRTERQELAWLQRCRLSGTTVLDVGANLGIYSYWMHRAVGAEGNVIAFEPQPELCVHLRELAQAFQLHRLQVERAGLSSQPGEALLTRPVAHWGGASLENHACYAQTETESLAVDVTTIDDYFAARAELRPVRFIKCDVEGHEAEVLRGGLRVLQQDRPQLLVECHEPQRQELVGLLQRVGYGAHFFFRGRLLPLEEFSAYRDRIRAAYLNLVFRPLEQTAARAA